MHLEAQSRADRQEPGEPARQPVEVGLHQGALLVREELDVARPDEIHRRLSILREKTVSSVERLEAGEDGRIVRLVSQERAETFDPVVGRAVGQVHPEDVVEDGVVRCADRVHVIEQQHLGTTAAVPDVDVAGAVSVQPERQEGEPDVVRGECGHPGPLEARGQEPVDPRVARRDLEVAVEDAALAGRRPPASACHPAIVSGVPLRRTSSCGVGMSSLGIITRSASAPIGEANDRMSETSGPGRHEEPAESIHARPIETIDAEPRPLLARREEVVVGEGGYVVNSARARAA